MAANSVSVSSGAVLSAGCDWITGTTADVSEGYRLASWASELITFYLRTGFDRKAWSMAGFNGYQCGPIQLGRRNDECIVRLSSDAAARSWREVYRRSENITRFDVQFTHVNDVTARKRIASHYRQALKYAETLKRSPNVTLIRSNDGTDTLYLGKRNSERYGRIYSKGHEKKWTTDREAVRFEVEFKGNLAQLSARKLASGKSDPTGATSMVAGFLRKRGISLPGKLVTPTFIKDSASVSDVSRQLVWLRSGVAPTVAKLVERGLLLEVLDSLGLSAFVGILEP